MIVLAPYSIIDNALTDPVSISNIARQEKYYPPDENVYWRGLRTNNLSHDCIFPAINKVFTFSDLPPYTFNYRMDYTNHILFKDVRPPEQSWWHRDVIDTIFAGVIYLNEHPEPDSGTEILLPNGENIIVENIFNRLLIYNSSLMHRPRGGFGDDMSNGRLTFTFFIRSINFNFEKER